MANYAIPIIEETKASIKNTVDNIIKNISSKEVYSNVSRNAARHKSLDFSDIGLADNDQVTNKHLRKFHQTRLYISDFSNMYGHTDIKNFDTYLISANLPEQFSYNIGSKWEMPLNSFSGGNLVNGVMQMVSGTYTGGTDAISSVNRATTLKVWAGTEPLRLSLRIPVIDDGYELQKDATGKNTNFVEALEFLGSLCLPKQVGALGFYSPPPSPLNVSIKYDGQEKLNLRTNYAHILLQLGGILIVDNCIVESISVEYPNTKTMIRHTYPNHIRPGDSGNSYLVPLLANVTINISTIEAMTADTYSNMLWNKRQSNMGYGEIDVADFLPVDKTEKKE